MKTSATIPVHAARRVWTLVGAAIFATNARANSNTPHLLHCNLNLYHTGPPSPASSRYHDVTHGQGRYRMVFG